MVDSLKSPDANLAEALIEPVIDCFAGTLATVAAEREPLREQCDALAGELQRLFDPPSSGPTWDTSWDGDVPF